MFLDSLQRPDRDQLSRAASGGDKIRSITFSKKENIIDFLQPTDITTDSNPSDFNITCMFCFPKNRFQTNWELLENRVNQTLH